MGLRLCFVGDSITNGTGDQGFLGWPGRLCRDAVADGCDLTDYNLGIRGDTSADILSRWEAEVRVRLPQTLTGAVIFNFGLNDATEEDGVIRVPMADTVKNARAILGAAKAEWPVLWVGPTPVDDSRMPLTTDDGRVRDKRNARSADYNLSFKAMSYELEVPYLDMMSKLVNETAWPDMLADGLHPNPDGHQFMAEIVAAWPAWQALLADA